MVDRFEFSIQGAPDLQRLTLGLLVPDRQAFRKRLVHKICAHCAARTIGPQDSATPALSACPSKEGTCSLLPSLNQTVPSLGFPFV